MPIHDFKCNKCENEYKNKIVSFSTSDSGYPCEKEKCDGTMERVKKIERTTFHLKGKFH